MWVFILSFSGSFIYKHMWLSMIKSQLISCHFLFSNTLPIIWKLQHLIKHVMLFHTSVTLLTLLSFLRMLSSDPHYLYPPNTCCVFRFSPTSPVLRNILWLPFISYSKLTTLSFVLSLHFRPFYHGTYITVLAYLNLWLSLLLLLLLSRFSRARLCATP